MEVDKDKGVIERVITKLSLLAVLGGSLAAINQYVGYSFLNGRLQGLGLAAPEIKLSSYEASYQTMLAIHSFSKTWNQQITDLLIDNFLMFAMFSLVAGFYIFFIFDFLKPKPNKVDGENEKHKTFDSGWKQKLAVISIKLLGYPLGAGIFIVISLITVSSVLTLVWGMLSLSYTVGTDFGKSEISKEVCKPIKEAKLDSGRIAGCSLYRDAYGNIFEGRIIHLTNNFTAIVTNTESILLNENNEHLACSPIYDLSQKEKPQNENKCFLNIDKVSAEK